MLKSRLRILHLVCVLVIVATDAKAEVSVNSFDTDGSLGMGALTGQISAVDVKQLERLLPPGTASDRGMARHLSIESPGGDWNAAMAIGRILRRADVAVMVDKNGCHSACVMVLAGAPRRIIFGPVGIHRPYPNDVQLRFYSDAQQRFRKMAATAKLYLEEMNLPASLFDAMTRVPPESLRILSREELVSFGLEGRDPVTQELDDANEARRYGLDRRTYLERTARRDSLCTEIAARYISEPSRAAQEYVACGREVMQGRR